MLLSKFWVVNNAEYKFIQFLILDYIYIVTRKLYFYPRTVLYFRTCEDGAGWHLIPCRISPRSEFFSRAHKNGHITWEINLWPDWPPLARGSKFHTIHTPTKATSLPPLDNGRYGPLGWDVIILIIVVGNSGFPMWYFKGINRTILSEHIIRRIEAGKEIWHNKLVEDTANNNFDHVGTLKYINLLLHLDIHLQRVKYIINEQSMNINVFLLFLSFIFLQIERERERVYKIGYKEKWSQSLLIFFLWWSSCGEYFLFYGLIDFMLFLILAWRTWLLRVQDIFFVFFYPEYWLWFRLPRTLSNN